MIKGALFDVDYTLFSHETFTVPECNYILLNKLKEKGIKIGVCSSRLVGEMSTVDKQLWDMMNNSRTNMKI